MKKIKWSLICLPLLWACNGGENAQNKTGENTELNRDSVLEESVENSVDEVEEIPVPIYFAKIDSQVINEINNYTNEKFEDAFGYYGQSEYITEKWSETLWGRCCTEADLRFTETMSFKIHTAKQGKSYPFKNALDQDYSTAYVFEEKDQISIQVEFDREETLFYSDSIKMRDKISGSDTILSTFQMTIINGYTKSQKTFNANGKIKGLELWLNGEHQCNVLLENIPDPQVIKGDFPLFMNDVVEMKPISFYPGITYDDICITELQTALGGIAHPKLDVKYINWKEWH